MRWIAPVLSFTADEIWQHLPGERAGNVLFATWYDGLGAAAGRRRLRCRRRPLMDALLALREAVSKVLEPMRADGAIGASLEAEVDVYADADAMRWLRAGSPTNCASSSSPRAATCSRVGRPADARAGGREAWIVRQRRRRTPSACAAGTTAPTSAAMPTIPELCGRCVENVDGAGETRRFF